METVETKLAVHEAVCAERYRSIEEKLDRSKDRMKHVEYMLYALMLAVLFGPGVAASFVQKLLGI
jgi:hypothetical protein